MFDFFCLRLNFNVEILIFYLSFYIFLILNYRITSKNVSSGEIGECSTV